MGNNVIPLPTGIRNSPRESGDLVVVRHPVEKLNRVWFPAFAGKISGFLPSQE